ncbi:MAG: glycosyltransferase family 4 protein, partial [Deltaproteobacteria bacterium]|nr:glycosyltransferase family 4 protein [Deltaproteobacteria bacterium]
SRTIFQNPDDLKLFVQKRLIHPAQALMIKGSGVDMKAFAPKKEAAGPPLVVLASRMLWDKGVGEFIQAAQRLQKQGIQARFALVGDPDPGNPSSVTADQLKQWAADGIVEWWGRREDMAQVFHQAHIVCLPSYREGLPKVLIEAAACGKPIVASDMPGCREVVWDGQNGLLVPVKNALALADALETLIGDTPLRERMGQAGRAIALEEFPVEKVVALTLALYQGLLPPKI